MGQETLPFVRLNRSNSFTLANFPTCVIFLNPSDINNPFVNVCSVRFVCTPDFKC